MCRSATLTSTHLAFNSKIKEGLALYMPPGWAHNGVSAGSAAFVAVSTHPNRVRPSLLSGRLRAPLLDGRSP